MKWIQKRNRFESSNCTFDPSTGEGYSYGWWQVSRIIGGKKFFNCYHYSNTTCRHQSKIRAHFSNGWAQPVAVEAPEGLQYPRKAIEYMDDRIADLREMNDNGRKDSGAYNWRENQIQGYKYAIEQLEEALAKEDEASRPIRQKRQQVQAPALEEVS